jgi:hypothetical protein
MRPEIRVVCTGKGTHREVEFKPHFTDGRLVPGEHVCWQPFPEWREGSNTRWSRGGALRVIGPIPLKSSYKFKCKCCPRNEQLSRATLVRLLDGVRESGESLLDVSQLLF